MRSYGVQGLPGSITDGEKPLERLDNARRGSASAGGLSKGAVAGIVIAAVCAAIAAAAGVAFLVLSRRRRAQGWQKESLDGQPTGFSGGTGFTSGRQPGLELSKSSAAH